MKEETPPPALPGSPDDRATTFQAVQGPQAEHYSGEVLLISAYSVLWVILLCWVALLWRKQTAMNARLDELDREIDKAAGTAASGTSAQPKR